MQCVKCRTHAHNVNVWIQDFDDAKVESNKVAYRVTSINIQRLNIASRLIQRLSIASRLIQGQANKIKNKIRPQTISLVDQTFASY